MIISLRFVLFLSQYIFQLLILSLTNNGDLETVDDNVGM